MLSLILSFALSALQAQDTTVYIASKTDVTGVTGGNGSPVTAVTMDGSTTFYKFEFRRDEASF
ncbi:MAG: hypothetical protein QGF46_08680, partial [Planctomycetota bacterium]|nr:hypothetical protein [Planctomycetota bacterium]